MADTKTMETKPKTYPAACDIWEKDGNVICKMEMPGVSKENLDVKIDGDKLFIHGKKNSSPEDSVFRLREIRNGDYYHEFTLDETIDRNKVDASIKNGVVTITLGVRESEKPRKIAVEVK